MIEELRTEARQTAVDYLADMILYAEAQPRIADAQTRANQAQKAMDDGTYNLRITEDSIKAVTNELTELRRKLSANNQPNRAPAIQAEISNKETKLASLEQTKAICLQHCLLHKDEQTW